MKVLVVGLGSIGKRHVAALRTIDADVEIFALRSQADAPAVAGITNVHTLEAMQGVGLDFAIVSNPTAAHKATIAALLVLGCPLLIEKPLHADLDIAPLVAEVQAAGIATYVACNLRFLGCIRYVREALLHSPKRIQEVNAYCGSYLPDWRPGQDFRQTYSARAELGGGVHIDLIHELDYVYWLLGMPERVQSTFRSRSSLQITAIDYANYTLEYPDFAASVVLNYYRRDAKRTLELVLEDETWLVDLRANRVSVGDRILYASDETIADTYLAQMQHFVAVAAGQSPSLNTIQDAFNVLKICLGQ
jgi:predicted dehydrogenase